MAEKPRFSATSASLSSSPLSIAALVVANLVPLVGVLFFAWDHRLVIALFWIENLIIGAFNLIKMAAAMISQKSAAIFYPLFFIVHYGLFCSVHGLILWGLLGLGDTPDPDDLFGMQASGIFEIFAEGLAVLNGFIDLYSPIILLGVISLVLSRLVSFIENFLLKGDIFNIKPKDLMAKPYGQIVILHAGVIFGAAAINKFGSSVWLLVIIVMFKVVLDSVLHYKRHGQRV